MAEMINEFGSVLIDTYAYITSLLPLWAGKFIGLFLLVLLIVIYSVFIWNFYRFIATKNILELNLNKYNRSEHPVYAKLLAGLFYFLEYILILPFLIFFWFSIFTIFLIFLTDDISLDALLIISATVIASIRMVSYYKENLAKDLAKLLPFTLLAVSILNPNFFDINRIFSHLSEISGFFNEIIIYLVFIISLEIILRFFDFVFSLFGINDSDVTEDEEKVVKE